MKKLTIVFLALIICVIFVAQNIDNVMLNGTFYKVMEQPIIDETWDTQWISQEGNVFTRFHPAEWYKMLWLLSHDYLAGKMVKSIEVGDIILVIIDGELKIYKVIEIEIMEPSNSLFSILINYDLIIQTCEGDDGYRIVKGEQL